MFKIDFKRLAAIMLPISLRRPLVFGLLRAGLVGVERVYKEFKEARKGHNFRLTHNGQVCYLRGMLHYYFGPGFQIKSTKQEGKWLYAVTESGVKIPLSVSEKSKGVPVVYSEQSLNATQNDFEVCIPSRYMSRKGEIEAMVNKYKLITKRAIYRETDDPVAVVGPHVSSSWNPDEFNHLITSRK